jgi:hypothetical protein
MRLNFCFVCSLLFFALASSSQDKCRLEGRITDEETGMPIAYATISVSGTQKAGLTDTSGYFAIDGLLPGKFTLRISHLGYKPYINSDFLLEKTGIKVVVIALKPDSRLLDAVSVESMPFREGIDVPASIHSLSIAQIARNPGADNDISKVLRNLPGVAGTSSFRNDLIIRGGAPSENRFFLDDVEIPVINHLVTQGASGGAYSILNSNLLREVDYRSSLFPASRGNALSSVFQFRLKDGNPDSLALTANLGGTDAGFAVDGPLGSRSGYLFGIRRSYRQYVLQMLNFAFLPVYNDAIAKFKVRLGNNSSLNLLGIGALDEFRLNPEVGNNEIQQYLLDNLPSSNQHNYTGGAVYRTSKGASGFLFAVSRSGFYNRAEKYFRNDESSKDNLILNYTSRETSSRLRAEYTFSTESFKLLAGASADEIEGRYRVFNRIVNLNGPVEVDYFSELRFLQYGTFVQATKGWLNERISLTAGIRADAADYSASMSNLLDQLSGRVNVSLRLSKSVSLHAGMANYFQAPPLMTLSYRENNVLSNVSRARFIESIHHIGGIRWDNKISGRLTIEGFYKRYPAYMASLRDSISLAHIPLDFGVFGNFPVNFSSEGRAFGLEVYYQQLLFKGYYGMLSYTLSRSEFTTGFDSKTRNTQAYIPSTWDARHIASLTIGRKLGDSWELGVNWRLQSPMPFTPFDEDLSAMRMVWDVNNQGVRDYSRLNEFRGKWTNLINLRVDKIYRFDGWILNVYLDIENLTADADSQQILVPVRSTTSSFGQTPEAVVLNPEAPYQEQRYSLRSLQNAQGALIPTFGFVVRM